MIVFGKPQENGIYNTDHIHFPIIKRDILKQYTKERLLQECGILDCGRKITIFHPDSILSNEDPTFQWDDELFLVENRVIMNGAPYIYSNTPMNKIVDVSYLYSAFVFSRNAINKESTSTELTLLYGFSTGYGKYSPAYSKVGVLNFGFTIIDKVNAPKENEEYIFKYDASYYANDVCQFFGSSLPNIFNEKMYENITKNAYPVNKCLPIVWDLNDLVHDDLTQIERVNIKIVASNENTFESKFDFASSDLVTQLGFILLTNRINNIEIVYNTKDGYFYKNLLYEMVFHKQMITHELDLLFPQVIRLFNYYETYYNNLLNIQGNYTIMLYYCNYSLSIEIHEKNTNNVFLKTITKAELLSEIFNNIAMNRISLFSLAQNLYKDSSKKNLLLPFSQDQEQMDEYLEIAKNYWSLSNIKEDPMSSIAAKLM